MSAMSCHRLGDPQRGHPGAAGHAVPALLEGVGDAHDPHHARSSRSIDAHGCIVDRPAPSSSPEASGFLGRVVVARLQARGADVVVPRSADYDLTGRHGRALLADTEPTHVVHLAARVGGIGYNQAEPAPLYLDNLLMGTYVIEAARQAASVEKTMLVGTVCSYPKFTPVPFHEESLWDGYPEETNAPYGIAKKANLIHAQVNHQQYGQRFAYLIPTNLYGPGDKFHPSVSHVIPALIKKCVEAKEAGADKIDVWGTGRASREYLYVEDAAEAIVLAAERARRHRADQPRQRPRGHHPRDGRDDRPPRRLRRRARVGPDEARRPAAAPGRRRPRRAEARLAGADGLRRRSAAHPRLVPRQPRRSRARPTLTAPAGRQSSRLTSALEPSRGRSGSSGSPPTRSTTLSSTLFAGRGAGRGGCRSAVVIGAHHRRVACPSRATTSLGELVPADGALVGHVVHAAAPVDARAGAASARGRR